MKASHLQNSPSDPPRAMYLQLTAEDKKDAVFLKHLYETIPVKAKITNTIGETVSLILEALDA